MKKVLTLLLSLLFLFVITGCNNNSDEEIEMDYNVGIAVYGDHSALNLCRKGIIDSLEEEGIIQNENLKMITQNANYDIKSADKVAESLLAQDIDLLCAISTPMAQSAIKTTESTDTPVVFAAVTDPESAGLTKANATGTCDKVAIEEQLKIIRALMPEAKTIGIIYSANETNAVFSLEQYKNMAAQYDFEIAESPINIATDIPLAADNLLLNVDCVTILNDNTVVSSLSTILRKSNALGVPVFGSEMSQIKRGCMAGVGSDYTTIGYKTGKIIAKILKGEAKVSDIPYEVINEKQFFINPEILTNYGITLPEDLAKYAKDINTLDKEK